MARIKSNGIEIEYEATGKKADPALLLVMGLARSSRSGRTRSSKGWPSAATTSSATTTATPGCRPTSVHGACLDIPGAIQKVMRGEKATARIT